jgi:hypothetical protein
MDRHAMELKPVLFTTKSHRNMYIGVLCVAWQRLRLKAGSEKLYILLIMLYILVCHIPSLRQLQIIDQCTSTNYIACLTRLACH